METAYDPVRIQLLSTRTAQAVDELAAIRCSDPWAADALRTVRLLRANLEDLWLPLLAQIRSSRAMITWLESTHDRIERGREMIVDWLEDHRRPDNEFARMADDELIDWVTWFGFDALPFGDDGQLDMNDEFWSTSFTDFAEVIAERVAREPEFADRLLGLAAGSPMVGLVAGFADYPPDYLDATRAATAVPAVVPRRIRRARRRRGHGDGAHRTDRRTGPLPRAAPATPSRWRRSSSGRSSTRTWCRTCSPPVCTRRWWMIRVGWSAATKSSAQPHRPRTHRMTDGFAPGAARGIANSLIGYIDTLGAGDRQGGWRRGSY